MYHIVYIFQLWVGYDAGGYIPKNPEKWLQLWHLRVTKWELSNEHHDMV